MPNLGGWEILLLVVVVVLLFGAKRLPDAARGVGRSLRIFKAEVKGGDDAAELPTTPPAVPPAAAAPAPTPQAAPVPPVAQTPVAQPADMPPTGTPSDR